MSALIKASAVSDRSVRMFVTGEEGPISPQPSREAELANRIVELEAQLAEIAAAWPEELEKAREQSASQALERRSNAEVERLAELKDGIAGALDNWAERLRSWDALATGIANAVLGQVFADDAEREAQLASCVRRKLEKLETGAVLRVRVSTEDFPDEATLDLLAGELGSRIELVADPELERGSCVLDLKLGQIEVGPTAQWQRVSELLERLEREGLER